MNWYYIAAIGIGGYLFLRRDTLKRITEGQEPLSSLFKFQGYGDYVTESQMRPRTNEEILAEQDMRTEQQIRTYPFQS